MSKNEIQTLIDQILKESGNQNLLCKLDSFYEYTVKNNYLHDAIFVSFLIYLKEHSKKSSDVIEALGLIKETIKLFEIKNDQDEGHVEEIPFRNNDIEKGPYCSFCAKSKSEVALLISGPGNTFICNECVSKCVDTLKKKKIAGW